MKYKPKHYRICSCGVKLSPTSRNPMKKHRDMGHTIPIQKYDYKTNKKVLNHFKKSKNKGDVE